MSQTEQPKFLPDVNDMRQLPGLNDLFKNIDELIYQFVQNAPGSNALNVKRFVAGHVARIDLEERTGLFQVLDRQPTNTSVNSWNVFMGMAMDERKRRRVEEPDQMVLNSAHFDQETINLARQMRESLPHDKNMAALFEKKKEELEAKASLPRKNLPRKELFSKDLKKLENGLKYMHTNYGYHMFFIGVNEDRRQQLLFPPFAKGNTATAYKAIKSIQEDLGSPLDYYFTFKVAEALNEDPKDLEKKKWDSVLTVFKRTALDKYRMVVPAANNVPWKRLFQTNESINNWPEGDHYKVKIRNGKVNWGCFDKQQLVKLVKDLNDGIITFNINKKD